MTKLDKLSVNNTVCQLIAGLKLLGFLELPEAKESDEKITAYGMYVDNKPFLCQKLTMTQYNFSYFLTTINAWEPYLPENWKSWALYDLIKNIPLCGSVRP